jgi:hypothetical protein
MSPVIITLLVLVGVGLLLAIWLMGIYNGLGGVDTYRIHKMMAARVTTAR